MLNKNAQAWVTALRSGKYEQGIGQLKTNDGKYCCLGVACEVWCKRMHKPWPSGNTIHLPENVVNWLGLRSRNGQYGDDFLTNDNDGNGYTRQHSFAEIADIIESEFEDLFIKIEVPSGKA